MPAPASNPQPPSHGKDANPRSLLEAEREVAVSTFSQQRGETTRGSEDQLWV